MPQQPNSAQNNLPDLFASTHNAPKRIAVLGEIEIACRELGHWPVLGTDEVGRGPLAGPVVTAAVILRDDADLPGLGDSKMLTEAQRDALAPRIAESAIAWAIFEGSPAEIDKRNILRASLWAMQQACQDVWQQLIAQGAILPQILLVDGNQPVPDWPHTPQRSVVRGDSRSRAIAAASILAKVHRDGLMVAMETTYPGYGFAVHKGYPTPQHLAALRQLGPTPQHRRSFGPVAQATSQQRLF